MVPRTYPSTLDTTTSNRQMVAYSLPSISGLIRWVDYIPVKVSAGPLSSANTYNNDGYIPIDFLASITGKSSWIDYIPVYIDTAATDSWQVSDAGFIPYKILTAAPSAFFAVLPAAGSPTYNVTSSVLNSAGTVFIIPSTVLSSTGTSYTPI